MVSFVVLFVHCLLFIYRALVGSVQEWEMMFRFKNSLSLRGYMITTSEIGFHLPGLALSLEIVANVEDLVTDP